MKNLKESCFEFLSNDETRKELFLFLKPITDSIYNELYIYLWIICFDNLLLILIILANLFLLLQLLNKKELYAL